MKRSEPAGLHPAFHRTPVLSEQQQKQLLKTIERAAAELWPECHSYIIHPMSKRIFDNLHRATVINVKPVKAGRPVAGTVGALIAKMIKNVNKELAPETISNERRATGIDFTKRGLILYRCRLIAQEFDRLAGRIPVKEFGPIEWRAFVDSLPERFRQGKEMDELRRQMSRVDLGVAFDVDTKPK